MSNISEKEFFEKFVHHKDIELLVLPQSGSDRKNTIAKCNDETYLITTNTNVAENKAFFYFTEVFTELKLNTPKILAVSDDQKMYIQEFVGNNTLSGIIAKEGPSENVKNLVKQSLEQLYQLQVATKGKIDYTQTFEYEVYNELPISHDLFYFKFMFADVLEVQYHKSRLLLEFKKLVRLIESLQPKGLMTRDFQARNIMVNDRNQVNFIDYQSAMHGPLMYDVVSFLYQAKANFSETFRQEMLDHYYSLWQNLDDKENLKTSLRPLQLIRFLQVLGAYGFRGLVQRKVHFIASIEQGLENLYQFSTLWDKMDEFPELQSIISQLYSPKTKEIIKQYII